MTLRSNNVLRLQSYPGGVAQGMRTSLCAGRYEIVTNGPSAEFQFIGSDPYNTNAYTGLVVPSTPSSEIDDARYLFLLARASFRSGEQSSDKHGVRLVGIRQYAELIARVPAGTAPLSTEEGGPPEGSTVSFRHEIESPLWHPPDGNISWSVMVIPVTSRDTRNPATSDGIAYEDSYSPALLFETITGPPTAPTAYTPPNGGRPWGTAIGASLGNIHDLRYKWRTGYSEQVLDIPIPATCDVALFASVRQNDPALTPSIDTDCSAFTSLSPEDQFLLAFSAFAQYGTIAGALVFDQNLGEDVP